VVTIQVVTKVPSELSKRLLQAQNIWDAELQTLKARVHQFEAELQRNGEAHKSSTKGQEDNQITQLNVSVDSERLNRVESSLVDLQSDILVAESAQEATVSSSTLLQCVADSSRLIGCERSEPRPWRG
jgi:hypothetical protein